MNKLAKDLFLLNTKFANVHGLMNVNLFILILDLK